MGTTHFLLVLIVALSYVADAANMCGSTFTDARKCETACPRGIDGECPSGERCFAAVTCVTPPVNNNYCGSSFPNAAKCTTNCPRGLDGECPGSERCYAGVSCEPSTSPGTFSATLVSRTKSEYTVYRGEHECSSPTMKNRIGQYWRALGYALDGCDRGSPWSAAFVSYMVRIAGGGSRFQYSIAHRVYIHSAFAGTKALYKSVRNVDTSSPKIGDLVCSGRSRVSSWTYSSFLTWYGKGGTGYDAIPTHCDIVIQVSGSYITVVGGNVDQRVTQKTVSKNSYAILLPVTG